MLAAPARLRVTPRAPMFLNDRRCFTTQRPWLVGLGLLAAVLAPSAQAAYKCVDGSARTTYQQTPCVAHQPTQAAPHGVAPAASARRKLGDMTVGEFMNQPAPGLENAAPCVKALDAELSRQWRKGRVGDKRTDADRRKIAEMRAACPELGQSTVQAKDPVLTAEQQKQTEAALKAKEEEMKQLDAAHARREVEAKLRDLRETCARHHAALPPDSTPPKYTKKECQKAIPAFENA